MFFEGERIDYMREMGLADNVDDHQKALGKLKPLQRGDFEGIFRQMEGCPALHEFLPHERHAIEFLAKNQERIPPIWNCVWKQGLREGTETHPDTMVLLTTFAAEFKHQTTITREAAEAVEQRFGCSLAGKIGTMREIPRACLRAGEIAEDAEFFNFGTNNLTQTTLGMSHDNANELLPQCLEGEIIKSNPFASIGALGVGELIKVVCERG
jgi:pyruvate,orthophosphate dikinase